jgi:hypothetical protein
LTTSWTCVGSGTQLGTSPGQAALFTLPDSIVVALEGFSLTLFTPDTSSLLETGVTSVTHGNPIFWIQIPPTVEPWLFSGVAYAEVSSEGLIQPTATFVL